MSLNNITIRRAAFGGARTQVQTQPAQTQRRPLPNLLPLWLLLPSLLVLLAIQVVPSLYAFYMSLTRVRAGVSSFVGLRNYERMLASPTFRESVATTFTYAALYVVLTIVFGLLLALLLNRKIKFTGVYLVLIFVPWVVSDVVAGTMWRWLFQPHYGIIQEWINTNAPFIGDSLFTHAKGAMGIVVLASVWQGLAFTTLLILGALQAVPQELLESAALDGANRVQRFVSIILPLIQPTMVVVVLMTSIRAVNSVGLIFTTTHGGPGGATRTASMFLLETGWEQGDFGTGAAISVMLLVLNLGLTLVYLRLIGRKAA